MILLPQQAPCLRLSVWFTALKFLRQSWDKSPLIYTCASGQRFSLKSTKDDGPLHVSDLLGVGHTSVSDGRLFY